VSWRASERADAYLPLASFPTRRSSDLSGVLEAVPHPEGGAHTFVFIISVLVVAAGFVLAWAIYGVGATNDRLQSKAGGVHGFLRSEEHTSELQSRENLVCRLLLEKKNA